MASSMSMHIIVETFRSSRLLFRYYFALTARRTLYLIIHIVTRPMIVPLGIGVLVFAILGVVLLSILCFICWCRYNLLISYRSVNFLY